VFKIKCDLGELRPLDAQHAVKIVTFILLPRVNSGISNPVRHSFSATCTQSRRATSAFFLDPSRLIWGVGYELLKIADQCLYESKSRGRDVVTVALAQNA
jgi:hypothetical protein